jgi:hypothetical protein
MDAPADVRELKERLFDRLARGQLVLLVGGGASRWAGLPSWRQIVCALGEDLVPALREQFPEARQRFVPPDPDAPISVDTLIRIPEAYRFLRGEERLVEKLRALLDTSRIDPSNLPLHQRLVRLAPFVPAIYTTNFDDLLERTFAWAGRPCQVVAGAEDLHRWRFDEAEGRHVPRFPVYKLHGTLDRPESLVIGESDFLRRSDLAANPIDLRFSSDVMGRELLLVGYGFNDPHMRWIWTKLHDLRVPPMGWFLELGASTDLERATVAMDRIGRVDLDASDPVHPPQLLEFLEQLAGRCEAELGPRPPSH